MCVGGVGVCGMGWGVFTSPFKGQCDIFVPKVSPHSSVWTLVANLKRDVMTLAACCCYCWKCKAKNITHLVCS